MFTTLVAVIAALVLGHLAPALMASLRDWRWFGRWLGWLRAQQGESPGRYTVLLAILPCVLLVGLMQWILAERLFGRDVLGGAHHHAGLRDGCGVDGLGAVAPGEESVHAGGGELADSFEADAAGGAGDEGDAGCVVHVGNP